MMNSLLYWIIGIVVFEFLLELFLDYLNKLAWPKEVPEELKNVYDDEKFQKQKLYRQVNFKFGIFSDVFNLVVIVVVLLLGGFALVDQWSLDVSSNPIIRALVFFGIIGVISMILHLPFNLYSTFVIEEKFGFNKTTVSTFWSDQGKSVMLGVLIGAPILSLVIWFYQLSGAQFWLYAWLLMGGFTVVMAMFYTSVILPFFNKQTPLEACELRDAIEQFCQKTGFKLDNLFVMDGSKRSTKANAFFSGLGRKKRIVLYDTLINDLKTPEIVAVLAHEIGHYKLKHTLWGIVTGLVQTGVLLFIFSRVVASPQLSAALKVAEPSFHIGLVAFGLLFSPVSMIIGMVSNYVSRKNEFAADRFAALHTSSNDLGNALKVISSNALSNPTPHPLYVFFNYSHPPLLGRLKALKKVVNQ
jgi:STE24 endopeptidase